MSNSINFDRLPWMPLLATTGLVDSPGIYFARDSSGTVLYVGKSLGVRGRWKNHEKYPLLAEIEGEVRIYLLLLPDLSEKQILAREEALIRKYRPRFNSIHKRSKSSDRPRPPSKQSKAERILNPNRRITGMADALVDECRSIQKSGEIDARQLPRIIREIAIERQKLRALSISWGWQRRLCSALGWALDVARSKGIHSVKIGTKNPDTASALKSVRSCGVVSVDFQEGHAIVRLLE